MTELVHHFVFRKKHLMSVKTFCFRKNNVANYWNYWLAQGAAGRKACSAQSNGANPTCSDHVRFRTWTNMCLSCWKRKSIKHRTSECGANLFILKVGLSKENTYSVSPSQVVPRPWLLNRLWMTLLQQFLGTFGGTITCSWCSIIVHRSLLKLDDTRSAVYYVRSIVLIVVFWQND